MSFALSASEGGADPIRVLHVDDDPDFAEMAAGFLEREGERFTVETARSAAEGLELLADGAFDCVVSDYDMPGRNGIEFLEIVRETRPSLPFVLYTGKGSEEVASDAISAGVTDYLQKGGGTSQYAVLANRVANAVDQCRSKRAAEAGRERLSLFFDQSPLGVIEWDENFDVARANERAEEILGYAEADLRGRSWQTIVPESDREPVATVVDDLLGAEGGYHSVNENVRADGERITCEWHNRVVTDDDGATVAIFSQFRDVTERRRHERELERTNALLSTLVETLPVGVLAEDDSRNVLAANERLLELFGVDGTPEEVVGADCERLADDVSDLFVDSQAFVCGIEDLMRQGRVRAEELRLRDGRTFARSHAPIELPDGRGHVWLYRDVTERTAREERLREAASWLEVLFDYSPDMIDVLDPEGTLVDVNRRLCAELGYDEAELLGRPIWELDQLAEPDDVTALLSDFAPDERRKFEGRYERRDGSTLLVEVHLLRLDLECEDRFLAISRDITERKERERQLRRQNEQLDQFASVVSHDLRNPLNVAEGRLALVRADCESEHLDAIERAHDRMDALVDDLLTLARNGGAVDDTEPVPLARLVECCWTNVETADAALSVETDRTVDADEGLLAQLFENLVRNAVEHGGEGVTVTVDDLADGFYVEDDGPGIPAEDREGVFDAGYSTADDGVGFGLAIAEQVVAAHGWAIRATEGSDGGARFEITGIDLA